MNSHIIEMDEPTGQMSKLLKGFGFDLQKQIRVSKLFSKCQRKFFNATKLFDSFRKFKVIFISNKAKGYFYDEIFSLYSVYIYIKDMFWSPVRSVG